MTDFSYTDKQRKAILEAIPLKEGVDDDDVMAPLVEAARLSIQQRIMETEQPYVGAAKTELDEFVDSIKNLGSWSRNAIDLCLARFRIDLEDLAEAVDEVRYQFFDDLQATGRPRNDAAFRFTVACHRIWCRVAIKPPPRRASKSSRFYKFVKAAMPPEVHGSGEITGIVRAALEYQNSANRLIAV